MEVASVVASTTLSVASFQDSPMPLIRFQTVAPRLMPRRARHAGPSCRGGASSLLRVGQPVAAMPTARAFAQRLGAAAAPDLPEAA